jgi:hypothetical protein
MLPVHRKKIQGNNHITADVNNNESGIGAHALMQQLSVELGEWIVSASWIGFHVNTNTHTSNCQAYRRRKLTPSVGPQIVISEGGEAKVNLF